MLAKAVEEFLTQREFINVATSDVLGKPNVAPKFLLKADSGHIYLVDYVIGRTYKNLTHNPRVSISTINKNNLTGYQINGEVKILRRGNLYDRLIKEYRRRQIRFSAFRIIQGVREEKRHRHFEASLPEKVVVFMVKVEEIVEISPTGGLKRKKLKKKARG